MSMTTAGIGFTMERGTPPTSSYWIGATREELRAAVASRRHQMAVTGWKLGLAWDNSVDAEASIRQRLAAAKVRAASRRAEAERFRGR